MHEFVNKELRGSSLKRHLFASKKNDSVCDFSNLPFRDVRNEKGGQVKAICLRAGRELIKAASCGGESTQSAKKLCENGILVETFSCALKDVYAIFFSAAGRAVAGAVTVSILGI